MANFLKLRKNAIYLHKYAEYIQMQFSCVLNISNMTAAEYALFCTLLCTSGVHVMRVNTKLFNSVLTIGKSTGYSYILACDQLDNLGHLLDRLLDILASMQTLAYVNFFNVAKYCIVGISLRQLAVLNAYDKISALHHCCIQQAEEVVVWLLIK
jgi:hypothetical protein